MSRDADVALDLDAGPVSEPPLPEAAAAAPAPSPDETAIVRRLSGRFFVAVAVGLALTAVLVVLMPPTASILGAERRAMGLVAAGLAAAVLWIGRPSLALDRLAPRVLGASFLALAAAAGVALDYAWGLSSPLLGFVALLTVAAVATIGARAGSAVVAGAVATVWALWATGRGAGAAGAPPMFAALAWTGLMLGCGWAGGVLAASAGAYRRRALDREARFRRLLAISADAYWEVDAQLRLVAASQERRGGMPLGDGSALGHVPWEVAGFVCDPEVLDRLQADIDERLPFRDVPMAWRARQGMRHYLLSGEPDLGHDGVFRGYWGVAREVTDLQRTSQALARTVSLYQDLFESLPTPLVLHRGGRVVDANPAAVAMFGARDRDAMMGLDLLAAFDGGDSRERARRRMEAIQDGSAADPLPVAEFHLTSRTGRRMIVRATSVGVETDSGRSALSIFVDDTERHAAEQAVRRSEAMLSHLVASSPDVITLTDLATGRYVMVNRTFERLSGWSADEAVGRSPQELGVWSDDHDDGAGAEPGRVQHWHEQMQRRDGRRVPMLVSSARFQLDRRAYQVVNARDMSEAERNRQEREAILESASIGIAMTREQRFVMANPAFEAMFGWPAGAIVGQGGEVVWPSAEAYRELGRTIGPALGRGEQIEIEAEMRHRDGSVFVCRVLGRAIDRHHPTRGGTIWIVEDITERRRAAEALARARDAAEAASRAKSAFLANTSHELRTPLNGLLGLAQLAREPGLDAARRTQYLDQIADSAQSLALIVSDILDLSKIEAGKLAIESAPFDLPAVLRATHQSYGTLAGPRGLELALDVDPALGWVAGDALRVRQIVSNYLSNAIKFTLQGGVRLLARPAPDDRVRIEVHDTGPGIDAATRARLFEAFSQADDSTTRRFGGTGLGLSICRQLAALMGGQVGVDSEPGRGSCFWVELPLPAVAAPGTEQAEPADDGHELRGARVLVVDDNEVNRLVAAAQVEILGLRCGQAADGHQALQALAEAAAAGDPYELLLLDLQMPELSGFEVARRVRDQPYGRDLAVVAHTAAALVSERDAALAVGMDGFLTKPTEPERLRRAVFDGLRRHRVRRAAAPADGDRG